LKRSERNSTRRKARGWLLDVYPSDNGGVTLWIISESGQRLKLIDKFRPRMYISGNQDDLEDLTDYLYASESVAGWRFVKKQADIMDSKKSMVLEIQISDCRRTPDFARNLLRLGGHRKLQLHNVDIPGDQLYLYENDLFPLAFLEVEGEDRSLSFNLLDNVASTDYRVPSLRVMWIDAETEKSGRFPSINDPIGRVLISSDGRRRVIEDGDEGHKLSDLIETVKLEDPDIVLTHGGDSFLFPYLARRAMINGLVRGLVLGREETPLEASKRRGVTFFSYGRIHYKAPMRRLYGRVHLDVDNSFIYPACGLEGLIEVSRTCRIPLQRASRASIGTIMSSLQLYQAIKDEILIPWKKRNAESFKSAWELLVADRGGFVFEPKVGLHDWVAEIDFSSMYPTLMATHNISAETMLCKCCPDSKNRVPELDYNICEKRIGIVPRVLNLILEKRRQYKMLRNEAENPEQRQVYDRRQNALKWILVTCFGYLGYKNARFGKVDAHIAVCAIAREVLLRAMRVAEDHGFDVVHGIVDSLWVRKEGASPRELADLCREISRETGAPISVNGRYKWIVFLPSRTHPGVPVLNRYYGVLEEGGIKVRGIEARRKDTPPFIRNAQIDMIKALSKASNAREFREKIPESLKVLRRHVNRLVDHEVSLDQLIIANQLSKRADRYSNKVFQAIAAQQLMKEGIEISAGQTVRYIITDADERRPDRKVKAAELTTKDTKYDIKKYLDLLLAAASNILSPFGYSDRKLRDEVLHLEEQKLLK